MFYIHFTRFRLYEELAASEGKLRLRRLRNLWRLCILLWRRLSVLLCLLLARIRKTALGRFLRNGVARVLPLLDLVAVW